MREREVRRLEQSGRHPQTCTCTTCTDKRLKRARKGLHSKISWRIRREVEALLASLPSSPERPQPRPSEPAPPQLRPPEPAPPQLRPPEPAPPQRRPPEPAPPQQSLIRPRKHSALRRSRRVLNSILRRSLKTLVYAILLAYIAVTVFHLTNGLTFGSALIGGFKDARVAIQCSNNPGTIQRFVGRDGLEDVLFTRAGSPYDELEDVIGLKCEGFFGP